MTQGICYTKVIRPSEPCLLLALVCFVSFHFVSYILPLFIIRTETVYKKLGSEPHYAQQRQRLERLGLSPIEASLVHVHLPDTYVFAYAL